MKDSLVKLFITLVAFYVSVGMVLAGTEDIWCQSSGSEAIVLNPDTLRGLAIYCCGAGKDCSEPHLSRHI